MFYVPFKRIHILTGIVYNTITHNLFLYTLACVTTKNEKFFCNVRSITLYKAVPQTQEIRFIRQRWVFSRVYQNMNTQHIYMYRQHWNYNISLRYGLMQCLKSQDIKTLLHTRFHLIQFFVSCLLYNFGRWTFCSMTSHSGNQISRTFKVLFLFFLKRIFSSLLLDVSFRKTEDVLCFYHITDDYDDYTNFCFRRDRYPEL